VTLALLLFAYDRSVMDRREAEEGEEELREELAHVGRLSVVGEMGTKIAHELNQPLGAIQNYIAGCVRRLRQHDGDPEEVIGALEKAKRETERASAIIRGLREFARHSEGRWSVVGVNDLVHEVLPLLSAELRESRIEPELELSEGLEPVHADRIQIEQVLVNLIRNSIEAMSGTPAEERRLIVKTGRTSDRGIEVQVEDTGCGLHPDLLPNLFQPFHTTKPKGMGIGLAISRTIVEAHEGTIRAEPRRGRGAVFRFQLPCPSMVVTA
jgi:C4-dicarboxylate-specific signal transduction histidine kinase